LEDNISLNPIRSGDWLEGPFWSTPVQVVPVESNNGYDVLSVIHPTQGASLPFIFTLDDWTGRKADGVLVVPHAREVLYRLK
jgi:hypothetical protein